MVSMKTTMIKRGDVKHKWHVLDAADKILGRLATEAASLIIGKDKTDYTPNVDGGDGVIVINASKIKVTGNKLEQKTYARFTYYPGGLNEETLEHLLNRRPDQVIRLAVKRMLPKNRLGAKMLGRLKVYAGQEHKHQAQLGKKKEKKESK